MEDEERYEIRGKVGEGGRGAVYRAYDRHLNRSVAIKRLFTDDAEGGDSNEAVMKESHALSAISSPHIVRVFDVAQDEEGPYVVMEFLEGKTLHEVVSKAPLVLQDFLTVAEQSLEALIAAHEAKLLHRDIKPGNLMLTWLPSGRIQLKLLDFGLAKFTEKPAVQTVAQKGSVLGSIYFMAPEQFERTALDVRTDLYSLGCVLYYSLTGQYPFNGENVTEVMVAHIQGSCDDLQAHRPDLSPALCRWIMSLIARDKDDRPATAQVAMESFEQARKATAPVTTAPVPSGPRLITGAEADTNTQLVGAGTHTGTQPTRTLLTTTGPVYAKTNSTLVPTQTTATTALLAAKTKSSAIPPWVVVVCSVMILSIVALGVAVAMRGDPGKTVPDPTPVKVPDEPEATPKPDPVPPADKGKSVPSPPKAKPKPSKPTWNPSEDFLKKDKDKNFKLTHAEFVTIKKGPQKTEQEQLFKKLDRDGNGHLTLSEFKNRNGIKGQ